MSNTNPVIEDHRRSVKDAADKLALSMRMIMKEQRQIFIDRAIKNNQIDMAHNIGAKKQFGFTLVCNDCGSTHVGKWERSSGGEYIGTMFKCSMCGAEEEM